MKDKKKTKNKLISEKNLNVSVSKCKRAWIPNQNLEIVCVYFSYCHSYNKDEFNYTTQVKTESNRINK